jgi:hypothetical protein
VELDPVEEGVVTDGTGVGGSFAKGSEVGFARASQVSFVDGGESVTSLARCARVSAEALMRHQAEHDPARRR